VRTIKNGIIIVLLILLLANISFAQSQKISVTGQGKALGQVLAEISENQKIQFAFDANYFNTLKADWNLKEKTLAEFLEFVCSKYHLLSEKIDNTIILYKNPEPPRQPEATIPELIQFSGVVKDKSSGEPLLFCNIGFDGANNKGTTTNELGIFSTKLEKQKDLRIKISHLGYQSLDTTITLSATKTHIIELTPFSVHIEAIEVMQQEKDVIEMGRQSEQIAFNPKQSGNLPRIDDSDLISSLNLIPGISFIGGATSGISIRGSSPSENLISLDGMPILETSHLFGNLSVLNAKFISQAFVSRGAFDATYGEKVSGVVELKGKSNFYSPSLDVSANLLNVSATANIPIEKKVALSGSYRRSYIDKWENYLYRQILQQESPDDGANVSPVVEYDDLNLKIGIKPSDKQELSLNFMNSNDLQIRDYQFNEGSRLYRSEDGESNNKGLSANWRSQMGSNYQQHLSVGYNELTRGGNAMRGTLPNSQGKGGKDEISEDENFLREFSASWDGEIAHGNFTHQLGIGVTKDDVEYAFLESQSTGIKLSDSIAFNRQLTILHTYWQEKIRLTESLDIRAGLRVNYLNTTSKLYIQPRWAASYRLTENLNLIYAGGLYNQYLSRIRKIDINGNSNLVWFIPDSSDVGILKARQHILGLQYARNGWAVSVEGYLKQIDGHVNLFAEQTGGKDKLIEYHQRNGKSDHFGLDLMLQYKQGLFTHVLSGSLSKSEEEFEVFNNGQSYPAFNDQRLKIRWTEICKIKNWVLSGSMYYHTGSPYLATAQTNNEVEFERLPYFMQTDLSAIKRIRSRSFDLNLGLSLLNVFNRENVLEVDYFNVSDNTGSFSVRTDITAVHFTPVFFINILLK